MSELSRLNPLCRFSGLASLYARCRPDYPEAAVDFILRRCGLTAGSLLIDVGCGTGISSRLFAQRGLRVIGIEPNAEMRRQAIEAQLPEGVPAPEYRDGRGEATGLGNGVADAVLAAQAFHWFDPDAALREFRRILKPGGWVALVWNERDEDDPFTAAVGAVIRSVPGATKVEGPRAVAGEVLLHSPLFQGAERVTFPHQQTLDEDGLLGRAFSASYAPREPLVAERFAEDLRGVFARFQRDRQALLRYVTSVYIAAVRSDLPFPVV
jgi:SAM-dependent methyltransferase